MIRKSIIIVVILLFNVHLEAQSWEREDGSLRVIDNKGIFLRDSSSVESKKLASIGFGEYVKPVEIYRNLINDTINGMIGNWINVEYNGITGYVFDAFVSNYINDYNRKFKKGLPQFIFEKDMNCGDIFFYNPDLNWYGLYSSEYDQEYVIRKINMMFEVSEKHDNIKSYLEQWPRYLSMNIADSAKAILLFGIPDTLLKKTVTKYALPIKFDPNHYDKNSFRHNIYPGEAIGIGKNGYIICYGTASKDSFVLNEQRNKIFKDYKVQLVFYTDGQEIRQDLNLKPSDSFKFIGDLNGDYICDLIITEEDTYYSTNTYLLMSGYEDHKLTKVPENYWGSCY